MLSTAQNIREQVSALTSTIYTNLSIIKDVTETQTKKAEAGDKSVNADAVVSGLVHTFTEELQKHDKIKTYVDDLPLNYGEPIVYGEPITPGRAPQEYSEKKNDAQNEELSKIMEKVSVQEKEARSVLAEVFDIYEQTIAKFSEAMIKQKLRLQWFESNQLLPKSSNDQEFMIKSQGKLLDKGSNFPQSRFSKDDTYLKKILDQQMSQARKDIDTYTISVDKFLVNLQKISQTTVNSFLNIKTERIVTRWTDRVWNTGYQMDLVFPDQNKIDKIEDLDKDSLSNLALKKFFHYNGSHTQPWNFESCDGTKSSFNPNGHGQSSYQINQANKKIRTIDVYWNGSYHQLSGLIFKDSNGSQLHTAGSCSSLKRTLYLEEGEIIVGVKAHYCKTQITSSLGDIQFLLAKSQSE